MAQDYKSIIKDIKAGKVAPIYLLQGEEPFFIDKISHALEALIPEESKDFNLSLLYGDEVEVKTILDHCRQFPMMAERRVVSVREAQNLKGLGDFESYLNQVVPTTVLVLQYKHKKMDGRSAIAKKFKKQAVVFESKKLYDNQIEAWVSQLLTSKGIVHEPAVPRILAQHLGRDLSKIESEVEKVETNLKMGETCTPAMIEKWVGISRDYNVFELQKAMSYGNVEKAMTIVDYFVDNIQSHHPIMINASLFGYFQKLMNMGLYRNADSKTQMAKLKLGSPYFLKEYQQAIRFWDGKRVLRAFQLLAEYDQKLKGIGNRRVPPGELMREMIIRMMG